MGGLVSRWGGFTHFTKSAQEFHYILCISACLLKLPDPNYEKVLEYCSKVLELDLGNVKTHFRRGLALYNLKKYEEALESFHQAEKLDSSFSGRLRCP